MQPVMPSSAACQTRLPADSSATPPLARHWSASTATTACSSSSAGFGPLPPLPHRRVVVTGIGLVTPLGVGVRETWRRLLAGESGLRQLREEDLPEAHRPALPSLTSRVAGLVPREALEAAVARMGLGEDSRRSSRFMLLALVAAEEALADARWPPPPPLPPAASSSDPASAAAAAAAAARRRTGVVVGNGMSGTAEVAEAGALVAGGRGRRVSPFFVPRILPNMAAGAISIRPFDAGRDGFVMGEGAGVLVLEELGHAVARGASVYAEVRGYGMSGDGHHITHPHPEGAGALLCMRRALAGSGVAPRDVAYVNAHATSTPTGDAIEQAAILQFLSSAPEDEPGPPQTRGSAELSAASAAGAASGTAVGSTKGATGHLLGAAGAVEAAFTVMALRDRRAPPTVNLERPEPPLLPYLVGPAAVDLPAGRPLAALSNSFGFGGTNSCLLFATL
ncbi:hypothetical protein GPECTOR_43g919 [Gonium pectorale]|uniref:beta-ketoacyl-[acyl-carrier-protein] synthase I n=1 Tax=Gonium pectorale TaxID=33097 RepID=A0A150G9P1_GONPE|nr:hypothetical protein GPECTOR_43g919 [Gonium pectorale]|eukprot:KXZ46483.1 hypothetical protein GPECTOR_43g919 [Gonium pectorale]